MPFSFAHRVAAVRPIVTVASIGLFTLRQGTVDLGALVPSAGCWPAQSTALGFRPLHQRGQ